MNASSAAGLTVPGDVQVVNEDGAWVLFMPGLPVAAEATTFEAAAADVIAALRDYTEDWEDHLRSAPNHAGNGALVAVVGSSTDEQLTTWLAGSAAP